MNHPYFKLFLYLVALFITACTDKLVGYRTDDLETWKRLDWVLFFAGPIGAVAISIRMFLDKSWGQHQTEQKEIALRNGNGKTP